MAGDGGGGVRGLARVEAHGVALVVGGRGGLHGVHGGQGGHAPGVVADLLLHGRLLGHDPVLGDARTVVVGGEARRRGAGPPPVGAAESHVEVEGGHPVADIVDPPLAGEVRVGVPVAVRGVVGGAPGGEGPALGLGDEVGAARGVGVEGGLGVPNGVAGRGAVEAHRVGVVGVEVQAGGGGVRHAPAQAPVVVEQRHGDAVGPNVPGELGQEGRVRAVGLGELVLYLVEQDRAAAVGDLVAPDNGVNGAEPGLGGGQGPGVRGAQAATVVGHVGGQAAHGDLGVDVGAGAGDDVEALLLGQGQEQVNVLDASRCEVEVTALLALVHAPEHVQGDGVVAVSAHLLEDVAPAVDVRQAPVVDLPGPDVQARAVHHKGVLVEGDGVRVPIVAGEEDVGRLVAGDGGQAGVAHRGGGGGRGQEPRAAGGQGCGQDGASGSTA